MLNEGSEARIDVGQVLRDHCHKVLSDFRESTKDDAPDDPHASLEAALRRTLAAHLPGRYGVGEGIVVDIRGGQTRRFGAVVFDRDRLPILAGQSGIPIWPFEAVYAVIDVMPEVTGDALQSSVERISVFKQLQRERMTSVAGTGFTLSGEASNPPLGFLFAEAHAADLAPTESAFQEVVESVPAGLRLDGYCVISGAVGCLGQIVPGTGVLLGFAEDRRPTQLFHFRFGDGALASFVIIVTAILNKLRLGEPSLVPYLRASLPY